MPPQGRRLSILSLAPLILDLLVIQSPSGSLAILSKCSLLSVLNYEVTHSQLMLYLTVRDGDRDMRLVKHVTYC